MFEKVKDKLSKKIKEEYDDTLGAVSHGTVKIAIQKDVGKFAFMYRKDIKKFYTKIFGNYIQILKYMRRDFKVKKYDGVKIQDEIDNCEMHYKRFKRGAAILDRMSQGTALKPLYSTVERLKALNMLFEEYPKILSEFGKVIGGNEHKKIDILEEQKLIEEAIHLKNTDLDLLLKEVSQDLEAKKVAG